MLLPTITEALADVGMTRRDVEFTCSGSADYLTGGTFTFVQMLEAAGAWPPISESHVEMDGAWALYEAWVRLQHGDVDVALVFASGRASLGADAARDAARSSSIRTTSRRSAPTTCRSPRSRRRRCSRRRARPRRTSPQIVAERRRDAIGSPNSAVPGDASAEDLLKNDYVVAPLREHDIGPPVDGAAAIVLVAGDRAREVCAQPAWIAGHRSPRRSALPGRARSRRLPLHQAGGGEGRASARVASRSRSCPRSARPKSSCSPTRSASATTSRSTRRAARSSRTR